MPPRMCTEILVGEEDPWDEHSVFLVGASRLEDDRDDEDPQKPPSATRKSVYWKPGMVIRVRFLGGNPSLHEKVQRYAKEWEEHANIKFDFVSREPSHIRISFDPDVGSNTVIGTNALQVSQREATMNLELQSCTRSKIVKRTVLHEFGHALGLVHEHSSPAAGINWDRKAVYKYCKKLGWSKEKTKLNVLKRYGKSETQFSEFDPDSIMIYPISSALTTDGFSVGWNRDLSETDKKFIATIYPMSRKSSGQTSGQGQAYNRQLPFNGGVGQTRELDTLELWRRGRPAPSPPLAPYSQASLVQHNQPVQHRCRPQFVRVVEPQSFAPYRYNSHCPQGYVYGSVGSNMDEYYDVPYSYNSRCPQGYVDGPRSGSVRLSRDECYDKLEKGLTDLTDLIDVLRSRLRLL